ncbi:MAG: hypothetical protein PVH12_05155 [Candidatus Bathyarchaeota archaeon]|jgi:hypothetical protein
MLKEVTIKISDDLYNYLTFLEKSHFVISKEEALSTALEFYKRLSMHDWLPYVYRMGGGRVLIMDTTMLSALFHELSNLEIFNAAKACTLKRKLTNPFFRDVDFSNPDNWPVVLRDLEIMGWGGFSRVKNEIKVESCPLPSTYLRGYFEGMFGFSYRRHPSKIPDTNVFISKEKIGKFESV